MKTSYSLHIKQFNLFSSIIIRP